MSTKKLIRDATRALERDGFTVLDVFAGGSTHVRLMIADGDRQDILTMAASPRDEGNAITILLQNARRHIRRKVA